MKYVFFKTRETRHTGQRFEHIAMTHKINIIILVMLIAAHHMHLKDVIKLTLMLLVYKLK